MKWRDWLLPLFILGMVSLFLWKALFHDAQAVPSSLIGHRIPSIHSDDLFKDQTSEMDSHIGAPFILHVFASWCGYCEAEHRFWMHFKKTHPIHLLALNYFDKRDEAKAWLKRLGNPYDAVFYDPFGLSGFSLGVYGTPETFLIDQNGIVKQVWIGPVDEAIWQREFQKIYETLH